MEIQLLSLTHGQCDARPTVRLPILHRTKLILLITDADVCEVLAQGCTLKCAGMRVEPARPTDRKSSALTNVPPSHTIKNQGKGRNRTDGMLRLVSPPTFAAAGSSARSICAILPHPRNVEDCRAAAARCAMTLSSSNAGDSTTGLGNQPRRTTT